MATISSERTSLTIPEAYLPDVRAALAREIDRGGQELAGDPREFDSNLRMLNRDVELLNQLDGATGESTVTADKDKLKDTLGSMLDGLAQILSDRLRAACTYGPVPMGDVLAIAEELTWVASEAIRLDAGSAVRLTDKEWAEAVA